MSLDILSHRKMPDFNTKSLTRRFLNTCIIAILLAIGACGSFGQIAKYKEVEVKTGLVSRDLLYALTQVLPIDETTIQYRKAESEFGRELEKGLKELGYGLQLMEADQGPQFLTYSRAAKSSNTLGDSTLFTLFVGDIGLERLYADEPGAGIAPLGPLMVYGTEAPISLSEEIFPNQNMDVEYSKYEPSEIEKSAISVVDQNVMEAISQLRSSPAPTYSALNFQKETVENVALRGKTNFSELDTDYRVVRKDIIVFPNDSLFLLDKGRDQIRRLVNLYTEGTDVIRLIGCSNGPTNFKGGNETLALGRSERIAQELISRKVSKSDIRDEGCWAGESVSDWPGRGVVVELQRKNS